MKGNITVNPGIHNLQIFFALGVFLSAIIAISWRLYVGIVTVTSLHAGTTAISHIPKSSVQAPSLNQLEKKHREEWIQLLQRNPQTYMIYRSQVTGHIETIKLTSVTESVTDFEVEVIGSGVCTLFVGVPRAKIDFLLSPVETCGSEGMLPLLSQDRIARMRQQSLLTSDSLRFSESNRLCFSVDSAVFRAACDDSHRVPLVAVLVSKSHIELTVSMCRSTQLTASGIHQYLLSHTSPECIRVSPVYVQNVEECMICYDLRSDTVILDCRHCCMCSTCIARLNEARCIVCRQNFSKYLSIRPRGPFENVSV